MVDKTSNAPFTCCINNMLFVNPEEVASTLVLQLSSILVLSFISHTLPNNLTHILHHLRIITMHHVVQLKE